MVPGERAALEDAHRRLAGVLLALGERSGLTDEATAAVHRLGQRGVEHNPVELVHLHSAVLALLAEAFASEVLASAACDGPLPRRWWEDTEDPFPCRVRRAQNAP